MTANPLFDKAEAASRLGIATGTIDKLLARKELRRIKVGSRVRFSDELIAEYISSRTTLGPEVATGGRGPRKARRR